MTYTVAALLGVLGAVLVDLLVLRTRLVRRRVFWATYPIIIFFQLLSNGILTGRNIVRYDPDAIIGLRLVHAPVEDLFFGFALVLLSLSVWIWLGRRGVQRSPAAGEGSWLLRILAQRAADPRDRSAEPARSTGAGRAGEPTGEGAVAYRPAGRDQQQHQHGEVE